MVTALLGVKGKVACRTDFSDGFLPLTGVKPKIVCLFAKPRRAVVTASRLSKLDSGIFLALAILRSSSADTHDMISSKDMST